ncbi:MAG TPA: hypothetical protein VFU05_12765 [Cyclobacteriaceae bacterium]|nr:hypothetical protein [Cyclobacteriaceae bacterium]
MKKLLIILVGFFITAAAFAQDDEPAANINPKAQEKIKAARIAFITERLGLTPAEAEKFWPVYREFSLKREELRKQYRDNRKNPDPNKTVEQNEKEALDMGLKLKQNELDLEKEYSGKLLNVVPAQKVMALRKAENDFRKILIDQIQKRQMMQQQRQNQLDKTDQRLRQRNN